MVLVKRQGLQLDIYQAELNKIIFAGVPLFQILKFYYNKTCYKVTESIYGMYGTQIKAEVTR